MRTHQVPGMRSLRLLDAVSRHLNFTRAAHELGLTPAAVSFQIKEIEEQVGLKLFSRTSRSVSLTDYGAIVCSAAREALEMMSKAVVRARRATRDIHYIKVTVDPQFATRWLMKRIESFRRSHPSVDLRFDVSYEVRDFELDDVDIAIRFGTGKYPGLFSRRLFDNLIVPICSPELLRMGPPLANVADLQNHMLAHVEWSNSELTWPNWRMWMAAAGVKDFDDSNAIVFTHSADALQAALAGTAVALVDFAMVADEVEKGTLVRPFKLGLRTPPEFAYYVVYPEYLDTDERIAAFRDWISAEATTVNTA